MGERPGGGLGVTETWGRPELKLEGRAAVELPDEIKKKSFSQSVQAAVQSSDLICFQGPFCLLLSCCASNRETAMGNINPRDTTHTRQQLSLCWEPSCETDCCDAARQLKRLD